MPIRELSFLKVLPCESRERPGYLPGATPADGKPDAPPPGLTVSVRPEAVIGSLQCRRRVVHLVAADESTL
jgi:hypothetical protein